MRLTPCAVWLRFHQKFGHGLWVAWYRDVVRSRILVTPAIENTTDKRCEIHVLTCLKDWLNLIWTLKSFYIASNRRYALCIHEDGSLDGGALAALRGIFPLPASSGGPMQMQESWNSCETFRAAVTFAVPICWLLNFDFLAFLESDRMDLFDSDLLFFAEPTVYLERVENPTYLRNTFNGDLASAYTIDSDVVRLLIGHRVQERVNTGFGLVHRKSISWEWTEEFLALPGILDPDRFWRIEQTIIALCSSRYGVELLPDEYSLRLDRGIGNRCFRHYAAVIRHLMYGEGIARLVRDGFLNHGLSRGPSGMIA
jgi:hypothetical protein